MLGSDGANGNEHGRVDSDGVVEQYAYDLLHEVDGLGRQQGGIVGLVRILDGCAIDRLVLGMRGVLGARGRGVLKLVEGLSDVCGNGDVTYAFVVVPVNGETAIEGTSSVDGDSI